MLLVVFGAGASYDSSPDYLVGQADQLKEVKTNRPPLAKELFGLRDLFTTAAQQIPKSLLILSELRYLPSDISVEQKLEQLRGASIAYPEGQKQLLAIQFYLQWVIRGCQNAWNDTTRSHTTYRSLLSQIDRQFGGDTCFVTFNYDTLLEEALTSLDVRFRKMDDYVSGNYKVIKLHGSVNWANELSGSRSITQGNHVTVANELIATPDILQPSNNYHLISTGYGNEPVTSYVPIQGKSDKEAVLPAIAIPVEKKSAYVCPKSHTKTLEDCVTQADMLLIIGWKGAEEDFAKLLSRLPKRIPKMIVSGSEISANAIFRRLRNAGMDPHRCARRADFSLMVRSGVIETFFKRR